MSTTKLELLSEGVSQQPDTFQMDLKKRRAKCRLWVMYFMDHGQHVAYIPSFQVTGYGDSQDEAMHMVFDDVLSDVFEHLVEMTPDHIAKELAKYGWKHDKVFKKNYSKAAYVDKDGILKDFNLPKDTEITSRYVKREAVAA